MTHLYDRYPKDGTKAIEALRKSYDRAECPLQPTFTQKNGIVIARPLTFKETIEARINAHNVSIDQENEVWGSSLLTCTGIAYKAQSSKFKIIPLCREIIEVDSLDRPVLHTEYGSLKGIELDTKDAKYGSDGYGDLTMVEAFNHPAWRVLIDDRELLGEYINFSFKRSRSEKAMALNLSGFEALKSDLLTAVFTSNGGKVYAGGITGGPLLRRIK